MPIYSMMLIYFLIGWYSRLRIQNNLLCVFYVLEEDEKPVSIHGKKAGVDALKMVVLNGSNYRFREYRRINILKEARKKNGDHAGRQLPSKKQKDVFIVNKSKFYLTADEAELSTIPGMVLDGTQDEKDNKHRILNHKLR